MSHPEKESRLPGEAFFPGVNPLRGPGSPRRARLPPALHGRSQRRDRARPASEAAWTSWRWASFHRGRGKPCETPRIPSGEGGMWGGGLKAGRENQGWRDARRPGPETTRALTG